MMALTMSFWLFFKARTALARDTLACDITSSMSFASIPLSSTCCQHKQQLPILFVLRVMTVGISETRKYIIWVRLNLVLPCRWFDARKGIRPAKTLLRHNQELLLAKTG